jgi:hypothetical protein
MKQKTWMGRCSYMEQTEQKWTVSHPADDIEVTFTSKDDFVTVMFPNSPGDTIVVSSGRIGGAKLPLSIGLLGELQTKLRKAVGTLEAN